MAFYRFKAIVAGGLVGGVLLLPACSFTQEALWPSLTGEDPAGATSSNSTTSEQQVADQPTSTVQPVSDTSVVAQRTTQAAPVDSSGSTGTFVGKKVEELRSELARLQKSISLHNKQLQQLRSRIVRDSRQYHGTVAAINSRLQVGTTPGNPILVQQFNSAQSDLDRISNDTSEMSKLSTSVTGDSTMSSFLAKSTRAAFNVTGALDEDHQQLAMLEDGVNRTVVLIERLLKEVTDDIRRQTNYVAAERSNLQLLSTGIKKGEIYGESLASRAISAVAARNSGTAVQPHNASANRRPLVVIRFDNPDVPFQQALYSAVSRVLELRPGATFDLVAVAPDRGGPARVALNSNKSRRYAESVLRSLVEMGLPPSRVTVSGKTSRSAKTNEVHLYLR